MDPFLPNRDFEDDVETFKSLTPGESDLVYKIYNLLSGGITDPQLQALLVYRHLLHTGWLPPGEANKLGQLKDDALSDIKLLREELSSPTDKDTPF